MCSIAVLKAGVFTYSRKLGADARQIRQIASVLFFDACFTLFLFLELLLSLFCFCFHIAASQQLTLQHRSNSLLFSHCSNSLGKLINSNFSLLFALNIVEEVLGEDQFLNSFSSCSISIANSFKIKPVPPALSGPHNFFFSRNFWFTEFFFFSFKKLT